MNVRPQDNQQQKQGWREIQLQTLFHKRQQRGTNVNQVTLGRFRQVLVQELQNVDLKARLGGRGLIFACNNLAYDLFDVVNHVFY